MNWRLVLFSTLSSLALWSCDANSGKQTVNQDVGASKDGHDNAGTGEANASANPPPDAGSQGPTIISRGNPFNNAVTTATSTATTTAGHTTQTGDGRQLTSSANSGATPGAKDCRDDWSEFPWQRQAATECTKCWNCKGEGVLPGMAFVACKLGNECFRFATVDNCNYDNFPRGSGLAPSHDPSKYCRKDYKNYTFFHCEVDGKKWVFQTVDATHYYNFADKKGDTVSQVASNLPLPGGCAVKTQN